MENSKVILLVEDDESTAVLETTILEKAGHAIVLAVTGEEAIERFRTELDIDLVLMDIDLGKGMDGAEAARKILALRDVPIVFISAHTDEEIVNRVKEIPRFGYIPKTAGKYVLIEAVTIALEVYKRCKV